MTAEICYLAELGKQLPVDKTLEDFAAELLNDLTMFILNQM